MGLMAKEDANKKQGGDRHKPSRQVRVNPKLAAALDKLAARNATTVPIEANRAIRELLERENLWPPKH